MRSFSSGPISRPLSRLVTPNRTSKGYRVSSVGRHRVGPAFVSLYSGGSIQEPAITRADLTYYKSVSVILITSDTIFASKNSKYNCFFGAPVGLRPKQ